MANPATITLPSFIRRIQKSNTLKTQIKSLGCELSRVGRSRNWKLRASQEQIIAIIGLVEASSEESWLWLAKYLRSQRQQLSHSDLINIAKLKPDVSVSELMAKTDCTVAQARRVIDEIEWSA